MNRSYSLHIRLRAGTYNSRPLASCMQPAVQSEENDLDQHQKMTLASSMPKAAKERQVSIL
ncbi:hypothetical protein BBD41_11735 [Paenibacillus ihbetae]|uniref:Uncharacterized protein n=1 Tax=Paenibacillus ihbetae TaxID=1870820 RepID=A0A1B2DZU0_9BACL|nr:hypothetical protein BBD41_11735 [Paenibacillus ihbetae]OOC59127.1 hypothetical protein BBD40_26170 [Paenibacillus ihbetae]